MAEDGCHVSALQEEDANPGCEICSGMHRGRHVEFEGELRVAAPTDREKSLETAVPREGLRVYEDRADSRSRTDYDWAPERTPL